MKGDETIDREAGRLVGRRIAAARRRRFLTQAALAKRLGWPTTRIIHYENGRRSLSIDRLFAIATALELHPAVFLVEEDQLADLIAELGGNQELVKQVSFFLAMIEQEPPPASEGVGSLRD